MKTRATDHGVAYVIESVMYKTKFLILERVGDTLQVANEIGDTKFGPVLLPIEAVRKIYLKKTDPKEFTDLGLPHCKFRNIQFLRVDFTLDAIDEGTLVIADTSEVNEALQNLFPELFDGENLIDVPTAQAV